MKNGACASAAALCATARHAALIAGGARLHGGRFPLKWLARTAGAIASMMIVVFFTKGRAKPRA
jgi:hypothetical protein